MCVCVLVCVSVVYLCVRCVWCVCICVCCVYVCVCLFVCVCVRVVCLVYYELVNLFQINEENLQFMQHRDVYCHDYFHFIRSLSFINNVSTQHHQQHYVFDFLGQHHLKDDTCKGRKEIAVTSLKLAINFLFHTYFHTRKKLR